MPEPFPILEVDPASRSDVEQLGSKPKFWFKRDGVNWLFKEARENTGEDWAEKVASEIARLLGLPTHDAELALWQGRRGCAVKSFLAPDSVLIHGNELLGGMISGYDKDKQRGQADHTFENIVRVIEGVFPGGKPRRQAALRMVGYLVLDGLVGNTDRHHQNWGVILERRQLVGRAEGYVVQLAPTFDHASSLGRELTDAARDRYLSEGSLERYVLKGRGGIFETPTARYGMSPMSLIRLLGQKYPELFKPWQGRIAGLPQESLQAVLDRVPAERISSSGRVFAFALLAASRKLIEEIP
jgi:hypothetical protein